MEIVYPILVISKEHSGAGQIWMMYNSYLFFSQLRGYLKLFINSKFLEQIPGSNTTYVATDKVLKMIEFYDKMNELISEAGQS